MWLALLPQVKMVLGSPVWEGSFYGQSACCSPVFIDAPVPFASEKTQLVPSEVSTPLKMRLAISGGPLWLNKGQTKTVELRK